MYKDMNEQFNKAERNTNLEILRIISMLLIVMSHCDDWGGVAEYYKNNICLNRFITDWLHIGGQIGTGCFLLISGYFMIDKRITLKKIFLLLGEVWFYTLSIGIPFLVIQFFHRSISAYALLREVCYAFFPVLFAHYWFVTAYMILMILSPFFNRLIMEMDQRTYKLFLIAIISIFVVLDGGVPYALYGISEGRIIPVFIMYFIAGYIRRYAEKKNSHIKKYFVTAMFFYVLLYISVIGIELVGKMLDSEMIMLNCYFYRPLNSPIVVVICVALFLGFLYMPSTNNKKVNVIAKSTFGVYLLHENSIIRTYLLPQLFPLYRMSDPVLLFSCSVGSVAIVYIICTLIDIVRIKTVEKWYMRLFEKYLSEDKIKYFIDGMQSSLNRVIHYKRTKGD